MDTCGPLHRDEQMVGGQLESIYNSVMIEYVAWKYVLVPRNDNDDLYICSSRLQWTLCDEKSIFKEVPVV